MPKITVEESFLVQAHALAECYVKLGELETQKDPIFTENANRIYGESGKIMAYCGHSVFQGQGTLISVFYMLLVLPLEWQNKSVGDFKNLDLSGAERVANQQANVKTDNYPEKDIALRHFRNALAHGRVRWDNGNLVVEDVNKRCNHQYIAAYSMDGLGMLAQSLSEAVANYIRDVIQTRA